MRGRCDTLTRKPRSDARRNRQHIVETARHAFAAEGLDLPIREIARRAGVGVATVYRHFPSRDDLVAVVLADQVADCEAEIRAALADPDSRRALRSTVLRFAERQVHDRGLNEALLGSAANGGTFSEQRRAHAAVFAQLVRRARDDGALRPGISTDDARLALRAISSLRVPAGRASAAVPRLTELLLGAILTEEARA